MSDPLTTARLGLPLLAAGQAQKEMTHNEALILIDGAVAASVEFAGGNAPPAAPAIGEAWLTGSAPSGSWAGQPGALAIWSPGGWRFVVPAIGATVVVRSTGARWVRRASGWQAPPAVTLPSGGTVIDNENRATVAALVAALTTFGIVITV